MSIDRLFSGVRLCTGTETQYFLSDTRRQNLDDLEAHRLGGTLLVTRTLPNSESTAVAQFESPANANVNDIEYGFIDIDHDGDADFVFYSDVGYYVALSQETQLRKLYEICGEGNCSLLEEPKVTIKKQSTMTFDEAKRRILGSNMDEKISAMKEMLSGALPIDLTNEPAVLDELISLFNGSKYEAENAAAQILARQNLAKMPDVAVRMYDIAQRKVSYECNSALYDVLEALQNFDFTVRPKFLSDAVARMMEGYLTNPS